MKEGTLKHTYRGFILVELIVVITILAILGAIGFFLIQDSSLKLGETKDEVPLSEVNSTPD